MIRHVFWGILLNGCTLLLLGYLALLEVSMNIPTVVVGGMVLGLANSIAKPILKLMTLPIILVTLGLFILVINGIVLWLTSYILGVLQFSEVYLHIISPWKFILATLLFSIVNFLIHHLIPTGHH